MEIAYFYPHIFTKGGAERVLIETLKRSKHNFKVFTFSYEPENTFEGFEKFDIVQIGKGLEVKNVIRRGIKFGAKSLMTKIPDLKNYEVFNISSAGIGEFITLRNHDIPIVNYCHTILRPAHEMYDYYKKNRFGGVKKLPFITAVNGYRYLEKKSWKHINKVMCNSENTKNRILNAGLAEERNITVVNPGVETSKFTPGKYENYFFMPGRIQWYKRLELGIRAFKILQGKNLDNNFKLVIAGHLSEKDKKIYESLKKEAQEVKNVEFIISPSDEEFKKLFANCYSMVFTAKDEDWGIVPLEAMSSAKAVIAVNEGGPKESVVNNKTGFLVESTPEALADAMAELISDKNRTKKMGRAARIHVQKYDWKNFIKKYDVILENITTS